MKAVLTKYEKTNKMTIGRVQRVRIEFGDALIDIIASKGGVKIKCHGNYSTPKIDEKLITFNETRGGTP